MSARRDVAFQDFGFTVLQAIVAVLAHNVLLPRHTRFDPVASLCDRTEGFNIPASRADAPVRSISRPAAPRLIASSCAQTGSAHSTKALYYRALAEDFEPAARQVICPSGAAAMMVSSPICKNISVFPKPKSGVKRQPSRPTEGRIMIVAKRGAGCGGRGCAKTSGV